MTRGEQHAHFVPADLDCPLLRTERTSLRGPARDAEPPRARLRLPAALPGRRLVVAAPMTEARAAIEPALRDAVTRLDPSVREIAAYHFGWSDEHGADTGGTSGRRRLGAVIHDDIVDHDPTRRGKKTYPVLVALASTGPDRDELARLYAGQDLTPADAAHAATLVERCGGRRATEQATQDCLSTVIASLRAAVPDDHARTTLTTSRGLSRPRTDERQRARPRPGSVRCGSAAAGRPSGTYARHYSRMMDKPSQQVRVRRFAYRNE